MSLNIRLDLPHSTINSLLNNLHAGTYFTTAAAAGKVDIVSGKGLSTVDVTTGLRDNWNAAYGWGDWGQEIVTNLTTNDATKLAAASTVFSLKQEINSINALLTSDNSSLDTIQEIVNFIQQNSTDLQNLTISNIAGLQLALDSKVNTVAGKGLSTVDVSTSMRDNWNSAYDNRVTGFSLSGGTLSLVTPAQTYSHNFDSRYVPKTGGTFTGDLLIQGSTSNTSALTVRNSGSTAMFSVRNDSRVDFNSSNFVISGPTTVNGLTYFNNSSSWGGNQGLITYNSSYFYIRGQNDRGLDLGAYGANSRILITLNQLHFNTAGGTEIYLSTANNNTINVASGSNTEGNDLWVNYRGYANAFTRSRDFVVGDGKAGKIADFQGSDKTSTFYGPVSISQNVWTVQNDTVKTALGSVTDVPSIRKTNSGGSNQFNGISFQVSGSNSAQNAWAMLGVRQPSSGSNEGHLVFVTRNGSGVIGERASLKSDGLKLLGDSTNNVFTSSGQLALKKANSQPYISWHDNAGGRLGYIQAISGNNLTIHSDNGLINLNNRTIVNSGNFSVENGFTLFRQGVASGNNFSNIPSVWIDNSGTSSSYFAFGVSSGIGNIFSITNSGIVTGWGTHQLSGGGYFSVIGNQTNNADYQTVLRSRSNASGSVNWLQNSANNWVMSSGGTPSSLGSAGTVSFTLGGGAATLRIDDETLTKANIQAFKAANSTSVEPVANTIPVRDGVGYLHSSWINLENSTGLYTENGAYFYHSGAAWYIRNQSTFTTHTFLEFQQTGTSTNWGGVFADNADNIGFVRPEAAGWRLKIDTAGFDLRALSGTYVRMNLKTGDDISRGQVYANTGDQIGFLDGDGQWCYRHTKDSAHEWLSNNVVAGTLSASGVFTVPNNISMGTNLYLNSKRAVTDTTSWLYLNTDNAYASGTYTPGNLRADGGLQVGSSGSEFQVTSSGRLTLNAVTASRGDGWAAVHVIQSPHWYSHSSTDTMYLGEASNHTVIRGTSEFDKIIHADAGEGIRLRGAGSYISLYDGSSTRHGYLQATGDHLYLQNDLSTGNLYFRTNGGSYSMHLQGSNGYLYTPSWISVPSSKGLFNSGTINIQTGGVNAISANSSAVTINTLLAYTSAINGPATHSRDKIRVWSSSPYAIGMGQSYTFGALSDYAMTFQMSNTNSRGFWWGDDSHTNAQAAMSLSTDGYLTIATSVRVGFGQSDTTKSSYSLDINGSIRFNNQAGSGNRMLVVNSAGVVSNQAIPTGAITGVTAGNGLTGGGSSGSLNLNVGQGTGISVSANSIAISSIVARTDVNSTFANFVSAKTYRLNTNNSVTATSSTRTVDFSVSNIHYVTLNTNTTLSFTNMPSNGEYTILIKQGTGGNRTVTWPTGIKWPSGTVPVLSTAVDKVDIITLIIVGGTIFATFVNDFTDEFNPM